MTIGGYSFKGVNSSYFKFKWRGLTGNTSPHGIVSRQRDHREGQGKAKEELRLSEIVRVNMDRIVHPARRRRC